MRFSNTARVILLFSMSFPGNCMSEFMGLIFGKYEAKVWVKAFFNYLRGKAC